jgi:hypothetical protein
MLYFGRREYQRIPWPEVDSFVGQHEQSAAGRIVRSLKTDEYLKQAAAITVGCDVFTLLI